MKTTHIFFFVVLFLIQRNSRKTANIATVTASNTANDALLRRDLDERYNMLLKRVETLENSAFA